jgi:cobyrinic acid a,c-diamide synthase
LSFIGHFSNSDIAVIEGNRGLFDGMDAEGSYSTSRVSRILKAPVVLIVDCTKTTRTTAAVLSGAKRFERGLRLGGVVLNMIAGKRHEAVTRESIERHTDIPVLGALPRLGEMHLPERHMGLTPCQEHPEVGKAIERASAVIKEHMDLGRLLEVAHGAPALAAPAREKPAAQGAAVTARIGVIRDSAFQFYYPENFEELERRGAELVEVSALTEKGLPDIDALYIGGGFPETHAIALSKNLPFRKSLKRAVEAGLPVYAECGGLMYLGASLVLEGRPYPMAGIFPINFTLHRRPQGHGYTIVKVVRKNPFYKTGTVLRGHEFHYSRGEAAAGERPDLAFSMQRGQGIMDGRDGILHRNVLATYTHIHALGSPEWAEGMIRAALAFRRRR